MNEKRQVQALQRENENLRVDIAKLEAPERIYTVATKQLGMVAPTYVLYGGQSSDSQKEAAHTGR
ncbi:cell division protein FtsL [Megasphaera stantonii]|nr:cell division protein FtsL [Megasphaera stantonii]